MKTPEEIIKALCDRGGQPHEIAELTDYSVPFIKKIIKKLDKTEFEKSKILVLPERENLPQTDGVRSNEIARRLIDEELLSEDLLDWNRMIYLYRRHERPFPARFSDRLRLEVFLSGIRNAKRGEHDLLTRVMTLDTSIRLLPSEINLDKEKDFIGENFVEDPTGINRDQIGYYREDEEGRWRQPVAFGNNGGMIVDSPSQALKREIARSINIGKERK